MPGKLLKRAHYDLVDETSDSKIPVHTDEAFDHGIRFKARVSLQESLNCLFHLSIFPYFSEETILE